MTPEDYLKEITNMLVLYAGINHPYVDTIVDDIDQYIDGEKHVIWHFTRGDKLAEFEDLVDKYINSKKKVDPWIHTNPEDINPKMKGYPTSTGGIGVIKTDIAKLDYNLQTMNFEGEIITY